MRDSVRSCVIQLALDIFALLTLAALVTAIILKFWRTGVSSSADMLIGVYRTFELDRSIRAGVIFPRIMPGLNFGYGGPLFEYYPPLTAYLSLFFRWLGQPWIETNKAVFTLGLLLGGSGAYLYARFLFGKRPAALLVGAAYTLAPYLLGNVYERGALAESFALALLPWLLWAAHNYIRHAGWASWAAAASLTALIVLSHNITALFALPLLAFFLSVLAWQERRLPRLLLLAGAVLLGLGISAFYWAPALFEQGYAQLEARMLDSRHSAVDSLQPLNMLIQTHWIPEYFFGDDPFRLSRWQGLVALLGIFLVAFRKGRLRAIGLALLGSLAIVLLLQWDALRFFWRAVPLVRFMQFPWRLLGLAALWTALLLGAFYSSIPWPRLAEWPGALVVIALVFVLVTRNLDPALGASWYKLDNSAISQIDGYERGRLGSALYGDFTPASMSVNSWDLANPRPASEILPAASVSPGPDVQVRSDAPDRLEMHVTSDRPFTLILPRIFFPGWRAIVDGARTAASPRGPFALVSVPVAAGAHTVTVTYGPTLVGLSGTVMSLIALLLLVIIMLRTTSTRRSFFALALAASICLGVGIAHYGLGNRSHDVNGLSVTFGDQTRLQGYALPSRTYTAGETLTLRLYWLAMANPSQDYRVFVHLIKPDDSGPVAQSDGRPNLGYRPMNTWESGEVVMDEHQIALPSDLAPGRYRLIAGVYRPDTVQNLIASGPSEFLPGDRIVLADIEILPKERQ